MKHVEVVCAIIKNKDNKYFCCQRGPGRALNGFWEFPGGKVEAHETHEETIIREIKEELNSTIKPIKYIGVNNHEYTDIENPFSITMYAYLCELIDGNLELSEHIDSKWATVEELKEINFAAADIPFIKMLKKEEDLNLKELYQDFKHENSFEVNVDDYVFNLALKLYKEYLKTNNKEVFNLCLKSAKELGDYDKALNELASLEVNDIINLAGYYCIYHKECKYNNDINIKKGYVDLIGFVADHDTIKLFNELTK